MLEIAVHIKCDSRYEQNAVVEFMGDWIDRLKTAEAKTDEDRMLRDKLRLMQTEAIKASLPTEWGAIVACAQRDTAKLDREFEYRPERRVEFSSTPRGFQLRRFDLRCPQRTIRADLGHDELSLNVAFLKQPNELGNDCRAIVNLDDNNALRFYLNGVSYGSSELIEYLFAWVLELKS